MREHCIESNTSGIASMMLHPDAIHTGVGDPLCGKAVMAMLE